MAKKKEQPALFIAPFLVEKAEAGRLLGGLPVDAIEQLIEQGWLESRTIAGRQLVKLASVLAICSESDPEPIDYPPVVSTS